LDGETRRVACRCSAKELANFNFEIREPVGRRRLEIRYVIVDGRGTEAQRDRGTEGQRDRGTEGQRKEKRRGAAAREVIPGPEGITSRWPRGDAIDAARVGRFTTIVRATSRNRSCNASRRGSGDAAISEDSDHGRVGVADGREAM